MRVYQWDNMCNIAAIVKHAESLMGLSMKTEAEASSIFRTYAMSSIDKAWAELSLMSEVFLQTLFFRYTDHFTRFSTNMKMRLIAVESSGSAHDFDRDYSNQPFECESRNQAGSRILGRIRSRVQVRTGHIP